MSHQTTHDDSNSNSTPTESAFDRQIARLAVGGYTDAQAVRTAQLNRIRDIIRKRHQGIPFDEVEDEKDPDDRSYGSAYNDDELPGLITEMVDEGSLTQAEFDHLDDMLDAAETAERIETQYEQKFTVVETEPIYTEWLDNVYGVSTKLTAKLLYRFGYCEDYPKVSNLWSYAGWGDAAAQQREKGTQLNHDPDAKTLGWNVADSMIKQGENSRYRTYFYDTYKAQQHWRMEQAEEMSDAELAAADWTPAQSLQHADARSRRYLAKKFLKAYWTIGRDLRGLETPDEWILTQDEHDKRTDIFENPVYQKDWLAEERGSE